MARKFYGKKQVHISRLKNFYYNLGDFGKNEPIHDKTKDYLSNIKQEPMGNVKTSESEKNKAKLAKKKKSKNKDYESENSQLDENYKPPKLKTTNKSTSKLILKSKNMQLNDSESNTNEYETLAEKKNKIKTA